MADLAKPLLQYTQGRYEPRTYEEAAHAAKMDNRLQCELTILLAKKGVITPAEFLTLLQLGQNYSTAEDYANAAGLR